MAHIQKDKEALKRYQQKCDLISERSTLNLFESKTEKEKRIERAKKDFSFCVQYYFPHYCESKTPFFHERIANKVKKNKKYKGWLKWGRGHAKSVLANTLLPFWLWINKDITFLLVVGQNEDKGAILLGDLQAELEFNKRIINDFGVQKFIGSWETGFFKTQSGFIAKAIGMGQEPRGLRVGAIRPDMIIADDWESKETIKNPRRQDEYAHWFLTGVIPVMDNKNRRVLICQNKFAPRMIFDKIIEENKAWDVDQVNAYHPITYMPTWVDKYSRWHFKEVEDEMGILAALAEYNNQPHVKGKMFTDDMIQWSTLPKLSSMTALVGRWDVAYSEAETADYNAVRIWGLKDGKKYLIDCFVKQCKLKDALHWIADFQKSLPEQISIQIGFEAQFWNDEIYRNIEEVELFHKLTLNLIKIERRKGDKFTAIIEMLPQYQNNRVYYNIELKSHQDTQVGLAQLKGIEPGYKTKDDAPDADKYAFDYLDSFDRSRKTICKIGKKRENRKY